VALSKSTKLHLVFERADYIFLFVLELFEPPRGMDAGDHCNDENFSAVRYFRIISHT